MFVVMAHRGGDTENHSYPCGIATTLGKARKIAEECEMYRGGKYACSIWKFPADCEDMDQEPEIVQKVELMDGWKSHAQATMEWCQETTQNKRMREALERCREEIAQIAHDTCEQSTENACGHLVDLCDEALKGGKG